VVTAVITVKVAFFMYRKVSFFSQILCKSVPVTVMATESVCQEYVTVSQGFMAWTARKVRNSPITPQTLSNNEIEREREREREVNYYSSITHSKMESDPLISHLKG